VKEVVVLKHLALIVCLTSTLVLAQTSVAGDWMLTQDLYGKPLHQRLTLKVDGTVLSGTLGRRPLDGTVSGNAVERLRRADPSANADAGRLLAALEAA
jgi:hypothetical protein